MTNDSGPLIACDRAMVKSHGLYAFVQLAWPYVDPAPYVDGPHIKLICEELERLVSVPGYVLAINIPPSCSKSLLTSVLFPAYVWTFKPTHKFLFSSYSETLVLRHADTTRKLIKSEWYQARWPLVIRQETSAKGYYENGHGGMRFSTTVGSEATGMHGDTRVIDDPSKPAGLDNPKSGPGQLAKVNDWYDNTWSSRNTSEETSECLIMQRLAQGDLTDHYAETHTGKPTFRHLVLPMEYEPGNADPADWRATEGDLLVPKRFGPDSIEAKKRNARIWAGQYQQRPSPQEGALFKREWLGHRYDRVPNKATYTISADLTFKDGTSTDYVVIQVWAQSQSDLYLVHQVRDRMDFVQTLQAFKDVIAAYSKARAKLIEAKANGDALISSLKSQGISGLIPINPKSSKYERATACIPYFEAGNILLPREAPWLSEYVEELATFPSGRHDDQVDATMQAVNHIFNTQERSILSTIQERQKSGKTISLF